MSQWESPMAGTLRVKVFGTNSQSRRLRKNGRNTQAEVIEKRVRKSHLDIIDEGYLYNQGCGRFTIKACTCSKCRKKSKRCKLFDYVDNDTSRSSKFYSWIFNKK